jgi:hypothetical protein
LELAQGSVIEDEIRPGVLAEGRTVLSAVGGDRRQKMGRRDRRLDAARRKLAERCTCRVSTIAVIAAGVRPSVRSAIWMTSVPSAVRRALSEL